MPHFPTAMLLNTKGRFIYLKYTLLNVPLNIVSRQNK